ncbi:hypothetical protein HY637_00640 [Candidatus Woesearchaeota archaeon]|nr:hypothetical protein [Candidatus Woesearchaeota archaeon]
MATFLDVTGLEYFTNIFVFLFVVVVVYATLLWSRILGSNSFVNILVSLLVGIFVLFSPLSISLIASTAPFLAVVFVFIVLINIAAKMLGSGLETMPGFRGGVIMLVIIVLLIGVGIKIKGQYEVEAEQSGQDLSKSFNLLFNPKFLGIILVFAVAVFTVALLSAKG